jgi:hypothetical protein
MRAARRGAAAAAALGVEVLRTEGQQDKSRRKWKPDRHHYSQMIHYRYFPSMEGWQPSSAFIGMTPKMNIAVVAEKPSVEHDIAKTHRRTFQSQVDGSLPL